MTFNEWIGWRGNTADFIASWIQLNAGLLMSSLGLTLMVKAGLGMGPWGVFQLALCKQLNITLGMSTQIVGFALLISMYLIGKIVASAGTIFNMYIFGFYIDYIWFSRMPDFNGFAIQFLVCAGSIVVFGIGSAIYLSADQGPGPRDGLMMALYMRIRSQSLRIVRTGMEAIVLAAGWLLGGPVGIGTALFVFLVGPVLQSTLSILPRLPIRLDRAEILRVNEPKPAPAEEYEVK